MTVTTIRPNTNGTGYNVTGAATASAALSDDSDSSFIRRTSNDTTATSTIRFGTFALTSAQLVKQVRLRARVKNDESTSKVTFNLTTRTGGVTYSAPAYQVKGVKTIQTFTGPWFSTPPGGGSWLQTNIDNAAINVTDYAPVAAARAYIYELFIDVDVVNRPSASVTSPSGSVTDTSRPEVSWTFSDTDGDEQAFYQIKVFSDADYLAAGFDPSSSSATYDSGEVSSTETSATIGTYLINDTYRAYVRLGKVVNGAPFWSDWAFSGFVMNVSAPTAPTLSLIYSSANNRVQIEATGASATGYDSQVFEIQRSADQATWKVVRDADELAPNATYQASINDYEASRGGTAYYRARSIGTISGDTIASDFGATASVTVTNDGAWWLKAVSAPSLNVGSVKVLAGLEEQVEEDLGVFRPKGRDTALVVSGQLYGRDGTYRIVTSTTQEWDDLYALARHQGTVLVQDPFDSQKYVRFISRKWETTGGATALRRQLDLGYVEASED